MPRSFSRALIGGSGTVKTQTTRTLRNWRIAIGALLALNLAAGVLLIYPPGGTAEQVERELASLQYQARTNRARFEQTRLHVAAVEKGRAEGDSFLNDYFLSRRTAYSALLTELVEAAQQSDITP